MRKKKVLINTNPVTFFSGFGKNAKNLFKYLYADGRFELFEYCAALQWSQPELKLRPWLAHGTLPDSQQEIQALNQDPAKARNANYGEYNIDRAVKEFQPDACLFSEDQWGVSFNASKSFFGKIPSVFWVTQDSLPLIEPDCAKKTPYYWCWSSFATNEMHRLGHSNVLTQYPLVDLSTFYILSDENKKAIRKRFGISDDTFIVTQVYRNQLRKGCPNNVEGYAIFKKQNPGIKSIFLQITSFVEGWDLPKLAEQYGLPKEELWCAYVSHETGDYVLAQFQGNDVNCPFSGKEKAMHTVSVVKGVTEEALNEIYNITDVISHPSNSGALEQPLPEAGAAGKILLVPDYSYGEDVIKFNKASFAMEWSKYTEIGTQFIKASVLPSSIARLLKKVAFMSQRERNELGLISRKWAKDNYDMAVNGRKIADFLWSLPDADWSKITLGGDPKNESFPMPVEVDDEKFIDTLYKEVLRMDEKPTGDGFSHWREKLKQGMKREDIYNFFVSIAKQENAKLGTKPPDLWDHIDKTTGKRRCCFFLKESIGDIAMVTSLFKSFHENHPNTDLYFMADEKYHSLLAGNPYVFKTIPVIPAFTQEMIAMGAGQGEGYFDNFYHVAMQSQGILSYLSQPSSAFNLSYAQPN